MVGSLVGCVVHLSRAGRGCTSQTILRNVRVISGLEVWDLPGEDNFHVKKILFSMVMYECSMNLQPVIYVLWNISCLEVPIWKGNYSKMEKC
jgi:hypothetical protein